MSIFSSLTRNQKEAVGLLQIGTFLEYFDLMLYVHMAVLLNDLFFPKTDPHTASLLSAFAFCSTFVMRPFGALIFGYIGDHIGRKSTVILTTILMAFSCVMMTSLPTYAQIGITASWIMLACRVIQGLSSMGEIIGAEIYLTEITKPPAQYPIVGLIGLSSGMGSLAALGVASLVTFNGLNWRIAFLMGAAIAIIGASARVRLRETPDFIDMQKKMKRAFENAEEQGLGSAAQLLKQNSHAWKEKIEFKTILAGFFIQCGWPVCFYFAYVYCGDILKNQFSYDPGQIIHHNFFISVVQAFSFLVFIVLSIKIYPLKLLQAKVFVFLPFALAVPYLLGIADTPYMIGMIQFICMFFPLNGGPAMGIIISHFPVFRRFSYNSFIYALARAIIYTITSFGLVYLIDFFGNYGLLIILLPACFSFMWAIHHFYDLERKAGNVDFNRLMVDEPKQQLSF